MEEGIKFFVGLDVHKDTIAVAVAETGRAPARLVGRIAHDVSKLLKVLARYGDPEAVQVVYEAGPTGYGLQRELARRGYPCQVIAPSLIPKRSGDRVKTDRRDCVRLAELARAGELRAVWIPDPADEAIRDLARAREDAVNARTQARHQLKGFLLRHDVRYAQDVVDQDLLLLVEQVELWRLGRIDRLYRVLAGGPGSRRARDTAHRCLGAFDQGLALRAGGQGAAGAARD